MDIFYYSGFETSRFISGSKIISWSGNIEHTYGKNQFYYATLFSLFVTNLFSFFFVNKRSKNLIDFKKILMLNAGD